MADETLNLPSADQIAKLTPEGRAAAQAAFVRANPFKKAEIEAAFNARPEPITPPTPKPASNDQAFRSPADGGLSYEQRLSGYRALLKHATDKQAVLDSAKRSGIDLAGEAATDAILAELNSQDEREAMSDPVIRNGIMSVPETPSGYHLRYERDDIGELSPDQVHRLDTETRQAFHTAGVPTALAQSLIRAMFDGAALYVDADTDAQRQLIFNAEGAKFRRMAGSDYTETARKASAMYNRLPAKFRAMIDAEYGWHSAASQMALSKVYDAIALREARAKK